MLSSSRPYDESADSGGLADTGVPHRGQVVIPGESIAPHFVHCIVNFSSQFPDLRVAKSHIGRIGVILGEHTDLTRTGGIIAHAGNVMFIYVQVKVISTRYHCEQVGLTCSLVDSRACTVRN